MKHLIALVGMRHRGEDVEAFVRSLPLGEPLELRRDPDNKFDPLAVQVWARGEHVGFLKAGQNAPIARWMDTPATAQSSPPNYAAFLRVSGDRWPMVEVET